MHRRKKEDDDAGGGRGGDSDDDGNDVGGTLAEASGSMKLREFLPKCRIVLPGGMIKGNPYVKHPKMSLARPEMAPGTVPSEWHST